MRSTSPAIGFRAVCSRRFGQIVLKSCLAACLLNVQARPASSDTAPEDAYERRETWSETMLASRKRFRDWLVKDQAARPVVFGPWHKTNPIASKNFSAALFPEKGVDLVAKDKAGKSLWTKREDFADGTVHNLKGANYAATYLFRTIRAARPVKLKAFFGSDDGLAVWLNGKRVISRDVPRVAAPNQDSADLSLKEGENGLLLKIYNRTGGHAFFFSAGRDPAAALWQRIERDFPAESSHFRRDLPSGTHLAWLRGGKGVELEKKAVSKTLEATGAAGDALRRELDALSAANVGPDDARWLSLYVRADLFRRNLAELKRVDCAALRRAILDLARTYPDRYPRGEEFLRRIDAYEKRLPEVMEALARGESVAAKSVNELLELQREALLANPLLDFDRLLLVKRRDNRLGLPHNWQGNCAVSRTGYDNEIAVLSPVRPGGELKTFFRPEGSGFVGDVDLHFDADKMLFSMPGSHGRWQIWQLGAGGEDLRQVTPGEHSDVDNYDACYLPDGRVVFGSTRCFQGIPCVGGGNTVANLCIMDADGGNIRQLCFDQDHNWCPTVMNDGRVLFTRWEYTDTPHYFTRLLFRMNPDGTGQMEYYGSNSYWPNSIFYARPIPGHPTTVVAVISGHHGVPRMGELVILDPALGRHEADGVIQRIPGYGKKVEAVIRDQLVNGSWPKFLHPYPLSDKYFLVSCKLTPDSPWSIYLVDVFDNMLPILEIPGYALFEPVPFRKTPTPPCIPDKVNLRRQDAVVYLSDVYAGDGLKGVPRGEVKSLRIFEYYYAYPRMGGHVHIAVEGAWDVHRIYGTVPVDEDGSAMFRVPANTPLAVQPLDSEGKALQIMRSWFTAMPGEVLSCVGCHERQNTAALDRMTTAARRIPDEIKPWLGPTRGFSFKREVQPVLNRYCIGCHCGKKRPDGKKPPDFTCKPKNGWGNFTPPYLELHPYVRRPGPESDYHLPGPLDYHADTSELVQMLQKGHHGVKLDAEAWDRLITWIDLNVPDHGTWGEHRRIPANFHRRRLEMRTRYANRPEDPEFIPEIESEPVKFVKPKEECGTPCKPVECPGWPFDAEEAKKKQVEAGPQTRRSVDLGNGLSLELVLIPAGEFVMGSADGCKDERPPARVRIERPFWVGRTEITNAQYRCFDPNHDSGFFDQHHKDHTRPGYPANKPNQPVVRVSWERAMAFCRWLSSTTGQRFTLPSEAQWEWACRAGTSTPFSYGGLDASFSKQANLADASIRFLAVTGVDPHPIPFPNRHQDFIPKEGRFNDKSILAADVGQYEPNPWGLNDMHGNVSEWTLSVFRPYPYDARDGREAPDAPGRKVVRGGSWRDRPKRARSAFRLAYRSYQPVFNVGFRVACPAGAAPGSQPTR